MFLCPVCQQKQIQIGNSVELQPKDRWDEETLQLIDCEACQSAGLAIYQESRQGALDRETVNHEGAFVPLSDLLSVRATLLLCPQPEARDCGCAAHRELREVADALLLSKLFRLES